MSGAPALAPVAGVWMRYGRPRPCVSFKAMPESPAALYVLTGDDFDGVTATVVVAVPAEVVGALLAAAADSVVDLVPGSMVAEAGPDA